MPPAEPPTPEADVAANAPVYRESVSAFLQFAAESLGVAHEMSDGVLTLSFDYHEHPAWPKPYQVKVAVDTKTIATPPRRVLAPAEGVRWLNNLARQEQGALVARPSGQPESVHEFSSRLFDAYQVDEGQLHLGGCRLSEVPFVRVTRLRADDPTQVEHCFYSEQGEPVDRQLIETLALADVVAVGGAASSVGRSQIDACIEHLPTGDDEPLATTVVLAKRAKGAVQFDIGEQCAQITFNDWTRTLAAPPFHCAASGLDTFHLAAIDDGRIVAADAIGVCEETGAAVLADERVTCAVTGKRVDPRLIATCPVSGAEALSTEFAACHACGQRVSRGILSGGVCQACRELPTASRTDTRVAGLLQRFPAVGSYRKFLAGEAGGRIRVMAVGMWRRLLFVMPSASSEPTRIAMRQGFAGQWQEVTPGERGAVLGGDAADGHR